MYQSRRTSIKSQLLKETVRKIHSDSQPEGSDSKMNDEPVRKQSPWECEAQPVPVWAE